MPRACDVVATSVSTRRLELGQSALALVLALVAMHRGDLILLDDSFLASLSAPRFGADKTSVRPRSGFFSS